MKICSTCQKAKPTDDFYPRKSGGTISQCKSCHTNYITGRWIALKERAIQHMGGVCFDCKRPHHRVVYDFHHLDPSQKDMVWNQLKKHSWDCIVQELAKCVLLCSNCHRLRHLKQSPV